MTGKELRDYVKRLNRMKERIIIREMADIIKTLDRMEVREIKHNDK